MGKGKQTGHNKIQHEVPAPALDDKRHLLPLPALHPIRRLREFVAPCPPPPLLPCCAQLAASLGSTVQQPLECCAAPLSLSGGASKFQALLNWNPTSPQHHLKRDAQRAAFLSQTLHSHLALASSSPHSPPRLSPDSPALVAAALAANCFFPS
ncbi:hypothetical protein TgHK011_009403 [Trichoderma gracile]|nr:hypothetical protein TgHK011_009403 [Trichoderma gracile]